MSTNSCSEHKILSRNERQILETDHDGYFLEPSGARMQHRSVKWMPKPQSLQNPCNNITYTKVETEHVNVIQRVYYYIIELLFGYSHWEEIQDVPSLKSKPVSEREVTNFHELIDKYPMMTQLTGDEKQTLKEEIIPKLLAAKEFLIEELKKYEEQTLPSEIKVRIPYINNSGSVDNKLHASIKILTDRTIFYSLPERLQCAGGMKKVTFKVSSSIQNQGVFLPVVKKIFKNNDYINFSDNDTLILSSDKLKNHPNIFVPSSHYTTTRAWRDLEKKNIQKSIYLPTQFNNIVSYEPVLQPLEAILEDIEETIMYKFSEEKFFRAFNELTDLSIGIVKGLQSINTAGYIHNDIKLENILVDVIQQENGQRKLVPKVTDFDLLMAIKDGDTEDAKYSDTPGYFLEGQPRSQISDIYALGKSMVFIQRLFEYFKEGYSNVIDAVNSFPPSDPMRKHRLKKADRIEKVIKLFEKWDTSIQQMTETRSVVDDNNPERTVIEEYTNSKYLYPQIIEDLERIQNEASLLEKNLQK